MALTEGDILPQISILLQDIANVRWPVTELRFWLNEAQRMIANLSIGSCTATRQVALVGGTKQTIPSDGIRLLSITRNIVDVAHGVTGRRVAVCDLDTLSAYDPAWAVATPVVEIQNYCYDERTPTVFYVYPPVSPGEGISGPSFTNVEMVLAVEPNYTTGPTSPLSLGDQYVPMLIDYILWRAFSKDNGTPNGFAIAQNYQKSFYEGMAMIERVIMRTSPNQVAMPVQKAGKNA